MLDRRRNCYLISSSSRPLRLKSDFERTAQIKEFLDGFHESVKFVMPFRIHIADLQRFTEMGKGVQIVRGVRFPVALDVLDHLAPDRDLALNRKIQLSEIELADLMHVLKLKYFECEHKIARNPVLENTDT